MESKDIENYEGEYCINNIGEVKALERYYVTKKGKKCLMKERILKQYNYKNKYFMVGLRKKGIRKVFTIHRLIAQAFIPNPEKKLCINHKNGIKTDNRIENLERCTKSENSKHSFLSLGQKPTRLGKFGKDHGRSKKVNQYTLDGKFIKTWNCMSDASIHLKMSVSNISMCCSGKRERAGGYKRKF